MSDLVIILDPAHGANVAGKCSPDGRHREYLWSRQRVSSLREKLAALGYSVYVTTESDDEPGLSKRKNYASSITEGKKRLLLSLHNNAAGSDGEWHSASGVEVYTCKGVTDSDICADIILEQLHKDFPEYKMRYNKDAYLERDKEADFTVLMGSGYMAVLIEWLFQDNAADVEALLSDDVNGRFENSIVDAIGIIAEYFN